MKYALLIVEIRSDKSEDGNNLVLKNIADNAAKDAASSGKVEVLNKGAYLYDLQHGINHFCKAAAAAESYGHNTRTLFFPERPAWVTSTFNA